MTKHDARTRISHLLAVVIAVLLLAVPLTAQDERDVLEPASDPRSSAAAAGDIPEMVTDRPEQTESSSVVAPGYVQVEVGVTRTDNDDDGIEVETDEILETLVRIGVTDRVEVRIGFAGFIAVETSTGGASTDDSGAGDLAIGSKVYLCEEHEWRPELAFLGTLTLPTGEESSQRIDPSFRLLAGHSLGERFSVGANAGIAWESEEDTGGSRHTLSSFEWTAVAGVALDEKTGAFFELFGDVGLSRQGGPRNSVNTGVTYLMAPNVQLDAAVGLGLSEDADDWFVGIGLSIRFPD